MRRRLPVLSNTQCTAITLHLLCKLPAIFYNGDYYQYVYGLIPLTPTPTHIYPLTHTPSQPPTHPPPTPTPHRHFTLTAPPPPATPPTSPSPNPLPHPLTKILSPTPSPTLLAPPPATPSPLTRVPCVDLLTSHASAEIGVIARRKCQQQQSIYVRAVPSITPSAASRWTDGGPMPHQCINIA
jgi:hypothetical protein